MATTLVEEWLLKLGAPDTLHTDQRTNFNSEVMKDICQVFMINKTRTSPYHPQANGQIERFNRVIADTISKYSAEKPQELCTIPPYIRLSVRPRFRCCTEEKHNLLSDRFVLSKASGRPSFRTR